MFLAGRGDRKFCVSFEGTAESSDWLFVLAPEKEALVGLDDVVLS